MEKYVLENENGDKAIVDTKTATCISWKRGGKEMITSPATVHMFPNSDSPLKGEFVPEERAKKVSFDRMIFKTTEVEGAPGLEYRCDVTMRADSLEYDITIKNANPEAKEVTQALKFNIDPSVKVQGKKGFTASTDNSVSTAKWSVPVGKFKETAFYVLIK